MRAPDQRVAGNRVCSGDDSPPPRRIRVLVGTALGSLLTSYLIMVAVAVAAAATASTPSTPSEFFAVGLPLWLAAHQIPLTITGAPLGALPLLPTFGIGVVTAGFGAAALRKLGGRWGSDAGRVVGTLAVAHASFAVLSTALPTDPVRADPWPALLGAGLVAAAGASFGLLRVAGAPDRWSLTPRWLRIGLTSAAAGLVALATAAALSLLVGLLVNIRTVHGGFGMRPGFGAGLGVTVLCLCYLPNALVGAVSWLAGPGLTVGSAVASPLGVTVGPLPPLPLFAAMPASPPTRWAAMVFVIPVAVGVLIGLCCRRTGFDAMARLRAVGTAVTAVAMAFAVAAALVSGRLAAGPFDPVELPVVGGALALVGWLAVPAAVATLVPARQARLCEGRSRAGRAGSGRLRAGRRDGRPVVRRPADVGAEARFRTGSGDAEPTAEDRKPSDQNPADRDTGASGDHGSGE